ncbi:precorrin-3B synthase [Yinghuangia aomiensis]|uniref:Precorrin-3B synthase n=1 Tax=Yinghuangia aomiensis TaxID=676205 RepID=A0ABP9H382_9ACTN
MDGTPVVRDRADACPGALDAAPADDGLIARVRLPGGRLTPAAARTLAACADALGKGHVDLTVRANLQLRGLTPDGVTALAPRLAAAGLLPSRTHDRVRNIVASPFAGRDPGALVDGEAIVVALDTALCRIPELAALPGRFLFSVDDGGFPVATRRHDVALVAAGPGAVALWVGGTDTGLRATAAEAPGVALAAAKAFLRLRAAADSSAWHVRELPGAAEEVANALGGTPTAPEPRRAGPKLGRHRQTDGRWAVSALVPLGRLTSRQLIALADLADRVSAPGHGRLRVSPWRGIVVGDVPASQVADVIAALAAIDVPADPDSPWRGISACSGVGECRRAAADVRGLARAFAEAGGVAATRHDGPAAVPPRRLPDCQELPRTSVHFAACERACGKPAGAATAITHGNAAEVTVVGASAEVSAGVEAAAATLAGFPPPDR